jgi:tetratricopeptide (TPR) repeat protein
MANACEALHYNEVELRYLKNALEANRKDIEVNRHCARSLARVGQFDQAISCWHRIEELRKGDDEAPRMISELTVQKARHVAGIVDEIPSVAETAARAHGKSAPAAAPKGEPVRQQPEPAAIPLNRRQRLEKEISDHPTIMDNYQELAELFSSEGRFPEAEKVLARALAASGNDLNVREQLENTQIRRVRAQLAVAEKRAASLQSDEARELAHRVRSDLNRLELEVFGARCQRYPQNMEVRYELAVRLKRAGNYAEAVRYLTEAQQDAHYNVVAALEMGECLQHLHKYEKALECYRSAAQQAAADTQWKRLALYRAGVLATGLKDYQAAEKFLTQLVQIDSSYRDAAARLDKIRQIGHN